MRSVCAILFVLLLFGSPAAAQEEPIEIELVPPGSVEVVELEEAPGLVNFGAVRARTKLTEQPGRCPVCNWTALPQRCACYELVSQSLLDSLWPEVTEELASFGLFLHQPLQVRAVSPETLQSLGGERLLGLYQDDVIYVNHDLTRREARGVLAHEFGHAWFFQYRVDVNNANELLFEGFPEFLSFLVLKKAGDRKLAGRILYHDKSVYGQGARRLVDIHNRFGLERVLDVALWCNEI